MAVIEGRNATRVYCIVVSKLQTFKEVAQPKFGEGETKVNIKTTLKASVATAALFAVAPVVSSSPADAGNWAGANDNSITMSGRIVRSLLYVDDGENSHLFNVDGASDNSRVRWVISGQMTENLEVGGLIEMNIPNSNPASRATFDNGTAVGLEESFSSSSSNGDSAWGIRHTKVDFKHKAMGTLSIGQSSVASDGAYEQHLGGLAHVGVGGCDYACGVEFTNSATGAQGGQTVGAHTSSYDGGRDDRIRYDTPTFSGFKLAASYMHNGTADVAIYYSGKFSGIQLNAAGAYRHQKAGSTTIDNIMGGSVAAKHDSGLNASFGYSSTDQQSFDGEHWHVAVGYDATLTDLGSTSFTVVYGENEDSVQQGDEASYLEVGVNQNLPAGVDVFAFYSNFDYDDNTATNYDDVSMFIAGTRIRF